MKEAEEFLRKMQENMKKKYSCDRNITVTRLEDLLQDCVVSAPLPPRRAAAPQGDPHHMHPTAAHQG